MLRLVSKLDVNKCIDSAILKLANEEEYVVHEVPLTTKITFKHYFNGVNDIPLTCSRYLARAGLLSVVLLKPTTNCQVNSMKKQLTYTTYFDGAKFHTMTPPWKQ